MEDLVEIMPFFDLVLLTNLNRLELKDSTIVIMLQSVFEQVEHP